MWALDIVRGPRRAAAPVDFLAVDFLAVFFAAFFVGRELFFAVLFFAVLFFAGGMCCPLVSPVMIIWVSSEPRRPLLGTWSDIRSDSLI